MLEIPEALVIARQINQTLAGRTIVEVTAGQTPHKFAFFAGDPAAYPALLVGKTISQAKARGGMVEIAVGAATLVFSDGAAIRHWPAGCKRPDKHQLLLELDDGSALSASIQMYGGIWCFQGDDFTNPYYQVAGDKPSPLSEQFDRSYFDAILTAPDCQKLSAKAGLATEQRIPGLGNGVLQDILYRAGIHPRQIIHLLDQSAKERLFHAIKETLAEMEAGEGRDTEKDLFGQPGGYQTQLSKNTVGQACPKCGQVILKESYLGGSVYVCPGCQPLSK